MNPEAFVQSTSFVILDGDCEDSEKPNATQSFISSILKFASKCYDAHIYITSLNLHEWQRITKYNRHDKEEVDRNTRFLHFLEQYVHEPINGNNGVAKRILDKVSSYFGISFEVRLIRSLKDFNAQQMGQGICWIYDDKANRTFRLILERSERYPDASERTQSIIEDLRDSSVLEKYFRDKLSLEKDSFKIRKQYLDLWDDLMEAKGVVDAFLKVGLTYDTCDNVLCKLLMECENSSIQLNGVLDKGDGIMTPSETLNQCTNELQDLMLDELKSSVEIIFRILREKQAEKERNVESEIREITDEMTTLMSQQDRTDLIHSLMSYMENNRPKSLHKTLSYQKEFPRRKWTNFTFLIDNFFASEIPWALWHEKFPPESLEKVINHLNRLVTPEFIEPVSEERVLTFKATHLYLSQCLAPKLMDWLTLFRDRYGGEEVLVQFLGTQTLTIDVDLCKTYFHGINLLLEAKLIYIGDNEDEAVSKIKTIDVSGLNGEEYTEKKPPNPTATGCEGIHGDQGRPGESAGHVLIRAKEKIVNFENLQVVCAGGHGARGQDAGDGTDGADGHPGFDGELPADNPSSEKRLERKGSEATRGENGGNSGRFGLGGAGGFGGWKEIYQGRSKPVKEHGKPGNPGGHGVAGHFGKGGKRGKHGIDRAWIKYSGFVWDKWEKVEGREGAEKLILEDHNGWFVQGCTLKDRVQIPPVDNGDPGLTPDQENLKATMNAERNTFDLSLGQERGDCQDPSIVLAVVRDNVKNEHKIQQHQQKLSSLHTRKLLRTKKLREIDELRCQIQNDFSRMREQLQNLTLSIRAQENYSVQNSFDQCNFRGPLSDKTPSRDLRFLPEDRIICDDMLGNSEYSAKCSIFLNDILLNIKDLDVLKAAERFIKMFKWENEETWWNAALFLKEVTNDLLDLPTTHLLTVVPNAYVALKNIHIQDFPQLSGKSHSPVASVLTYLTELVKTTNLNLTFADKLLESVVEVPQKTRVLELLAPYYVNKFTPLLKQAIEASKIKYRTLAKDIFRDTRGTKNTKNPDVPEVEIMKASIISTLKWKIELGSLITEQPSELLKLFEKYLSQNTDSNLDLQELQEQFFSSKEILNYDLNDVMSMSSTKTVNILKNFGKAEFIIKNYTVNSKQLDELDSLYRKLVSKGKQDFGDQIKDATAWTFRHKIQDLSLDKIFQQLNYTEKDTLERRLEIEGIVGELENFETKGKCLDSLLNDCITNEFEWGKAMEKVKGDFGMTAEEFASAVVRICSGDYDDESDETDQNIKESLVLLKRIQFALKYSKFTNLHDIEMHLVTLLKYLEKKKDLSMDIYIDFEANLITFWERELESKIIAKVRDRFDPERYDKWQAEVVEEVSVLLDSNVVLERNEYLSFLQLKLNQVHYYALREGSIEMLRKVSLHDEGGELQRLRSVLEALEGITNARGLPVLLENFPDFMEAVLILISPHPSADHVLTALDSFLHAFKEVAEKDAKNTSEMLHEFLRMLVPEWENVTGLAPFRDDLNTPTADLNSEEKVKLNGSISRIRGKLKKQSLKDFLKVLGHFITQNSVEHGKYYRDELKKLEKKVRQSVGDLERVVLDRDRISDMIAISQRTRKTVLSNYIPKWKDYQVNLDQLLVNEEVYYSAALKEAEEEYVVVGEVAEEVDQIGLSVLPQSISETALLIKVESKWKNDDNKRVLPIIHLTLQLLTVENARKKFLRQCLLISDEFFDLLKRTLANYQNMVGMKEFLDPTEGNPVRKLIVCMEVTAMNPVIRKKILELFLDTTNTTSYDLTQEEGKHFRLLLTPSEAEYFDKLKTAKGEFRLPGNIKLCTDWETDFIHCHTENVLQNLVSHIDQARKSELVEVLDIWRKQVGSQGYREWAILVSDLVEDLQKLPISFDELLKLATTCHHLPLHSFKEILSNHVPPNYLKYALMAQVEIILLNKRMSRYEVLELMGAIDLLLVAEEQELSKKLLQKLMVELAVMECYQIKSFFDETIHPANIIKNCDSRTIIISSWTDEDVSIKKWKQQLRIYQAGYDRMIPNASKDVLKAVMDLDEKFFYTPNLIQYILKINAQSEILSLITNIQKNKWTLDSTVMNQIVKNKPTSADIVAKLLEDYSKKFNEKELQGTALVDAIMEACKDNFSDENKRVQFRQELLNDLRNVRKRFKDPSKLLNNGLNISKWSKQHIADWTVELKLWQANYDDKGQGLQHGDEARNIRIDILAVILRAIQIMTTNTLTNLDGIPTIKMGHTLRDTQIAAVLMFLYAADHGKGRFGEIATSEGKTLVSASTAIILALNGHNVYVVTSSAVLAEAWLKETKEVFDIFQIGVGNIATEDVRQGTEESEKKLVKLYKNRVLVGDSGSFQADFLQCNYLGKTYKSGADLGYLIVDEADSLLLDKGSNVLYISHTIPELRYLNNIFLDIWAYTLKGLNKSAINCIILNKYIRSKEAKLFKFLVQFVQDRIPVWINNAIVAKEMKQDVPYILSEESGESENKVTIVDNDTGMEQKQTQYSFGLQQFLQLKEGNKISSESLKAVFVSNVGYFQRFKRRIFGITGTLGEKDAKGVLGDLYGVDFFKMPRHKTSKCVKEKPQLFKNGEEEKCEEALFGTVSKREESQPVLFICKNVKKCKELFSLLSKKIPKDRLKCIYESKEYNSFMKEMKDKPIEPGFGIISTNIAGRGTDLKLSETCDEKGLHVVPTYIPPNKRVEKQAFGRTARAGKNGSTEYIVLLDGNVELKLESHWAAMQAREADRLKEIQERQVPQIELEESLFREFAENLKKIKQSLEKSGSNKSEKVLEAEIHIVKNRWAFWLDGIQSELQFHFHNPPEVEKAVWKKYIEFCNELCKLVQKDATLCQSPSDFLKLSQAYEDEGNITESIKLLTAGIEAEDVFNQHLYYYRGVAYLKLDGTSLSSRKKCRADLKKARTKISGRKYTMAQSLGHFKATLETFLPKESLPDLKNLNIQMEKEMELLSQHEWNFLTPALGHSLDSNSFKMVQKVNQEGEESRKIFQALLKNKKLIQPLRFSKMVRFEDGEVLLNGEKVDFSCLGLSLYENKLKGIIGKLVGQKKREFDVKELRNFEVTREHLMKVIKEVKVQHHKSEGDVEELSWLEEVKDYQLLDVLYDDARFSQEFTQFPRHKTTIGKVLGERNLRSLTLKEAEDMIEAFLPSELRANSILNVLYIEKYLMLRNHFKGKINHAFLKDLKFCNGTLKGLPKCLEPYTSVMTPWLVNCDGKICPDLDTVTLSLLVPSGDQCCDDRAKDDVINILVEHGVLKKSKVKWSLGDWFEKEEERVKEIENSLNWLSVDETVPGSVISSLRTTFYEFHKMEYTGEVQKKSWTEAAASYAERVLEWDFTDRSEIEKGFKEYLKDILTLLVNSVGKTKTLRKINVESTSLARFYTGRNMPVEYYAMKEEGFDRVPVLKEKFSWWSSGAAWVALLGILQIAAGVAIAVLSGGTLANVSMMFISEGGGDLIFAAHSGWQGSFSWKTYGIHKVFSVACSVATGGLAGITGGSWATVIGMEVMEEIFKKTFWTVGRYAAQAVGTALTNMTIEKVLDWMKEKVLSTAKLAFQVWSITNEKYKNAKQRLHNSLRSLYESSYLPNQVETSVINAKFAFSPKSATSLFAHTLQMSMHRVASFYMAKVTEKMCSALGQAAMDSFLKLINCFRPLVSGVVEKISNSIQEFAADYINKLTNYFEEQAAVLRQRKTNRSTYSREVDQKAKDEFIKLNMQNVDSDIVDAGLDKLQHEFAEPALKQMSARWFDSKCAKMFKGRAVSMGKGYDPSSSKGMNSDEIYVPNTVVTDSRLGCDEENKIRNNIWDTRVLKKVVSHDYLEDFKSIWDYLEITEVETGSPVINFLLNGATQEAASNAEKLGVNFVRKFSL